MIEKIKEWLMLRYCPEYLAMMPEDAPGFYSIHVNLRYGYWGHKTWEVFYDIVEGKLNTYKTVRWQALLIDWRYPDWIYKCGVDYSVKEIH